MTTLSLYNTLTRKKEEFIPLQEGKVKLYSCGPTVYWYQHIGNMRAFTMWDLLRRSLEYLGFEVEYVINITDVGHLTDDQDGGDDKMELGAKREGKSVWDIAKLYTQAFFDDIHALNIQDPNNWCKATDHIREQQEMVQKLYDKGFAYITSNGIYFDTSQLFDYGKLVPNFNAEQLKGGKRVDLGEKKNKTDFALWKVSPEDEKRAMQWDFPMLLSDQDMEVAVQYATQNTHIQIQDKGVNLQGFPGWHIECTAMSCKYLGEQFDIHTGGIEHIPVHHTNEIAQAQGTFGHDHVRYWLHNEWLLFGDEKVSKSKGHIIRVSDLVEKGYSALDLRYLFLQTHYRKPAQFSFEALNAARTARRRLSDKIISLKQTGIASGMSKERLSFQSRFVDRVTDDVDIPGALGVLHEMLKSDLVDGEKLSLALDWDTVFGLELKKVEKDDVVIPRDIQTLVEEREKARQEKNWTRADRIRDELKEKGWSISDSEEGPLITPYK